MTDVLELSDELRSFLERRQSGVGATDSAGILGLSPWSTPLSVYLDKKNELQPGEPSLPMWLGNKLQSVVAELYTARTGQRVRADERHHRHKLYEWLVCHLDYRAWGKPNLLVECKTARSTNGYGEDGSDKVPVHYWIQCQHEMAVTGATEVHLAVLFGHYDFRVFPIARDEAFIERLVEATKEFWYDHVLANVPPLPIAKDTDLVNARHREVSEPGRVATPEQSKLATALLRAQANRKQAANREEELKNQLKTIIGAADGLRGPGFVITWRKDDDREEVAWQNVAMAFRTIIEETRSLYDDAAIADLPGPVRTALEDLDSIVSIHTSIKEGSRRFLATEKGEEA